MEKHKVYRAIGLMSGTSLDGIDAALIETDGYNHVKPLEFISIPYQQRVRNQIRSCFGLRDPEHRSVVEAQRILTSNHADAVRKLMKKSDCSLSDIEIIGFHGQTIHHDPSNSFSLQIGDGNFLATELGVNVVNDFRRADMKAGGQGAPLAPLYHLARVTSEDLPKPLAILNIGGIANVTFISKSERKIIAFDTGPGNALVNDFVYTRRDKLFDEGGKIAKSGIVDQDLIDRWMAMPYFTLPIPKSLDRNEWDVSAADYLSDEDGAATLSAFTVEAIKHGAGLLPEEPELWLACGGGRHNKYFMDHLQIGLCKPVKSVEEYGWNGDAVEAECFGYLAVRSILGQPLSLPATTGVPIPQTGGILNKAA